MRVQHAARPSSGDGHPAQPQKHLLPRKGASLYRTNSLFIGATRTDERAFAILSLIATAKANGLFPRAPQVPHLITQVIDFPTTGLAKMPLQPYGARRSRAANRLSCSGVVLLTPA